MTEVDGTTVHAVKDDEQHPIATAWRPMLAAVVQALVERDYRLRRGVAGVGPVSELTAARPRFTVHLVYVP